ncbi:hypothetical protein FHR87_003702 [Azomonas macrocytogenes]|uniref:Uncharacterized protein n=1 Tax=Azomonas macrocytogenes TaxID=69962 RepID=A0A839T9Y5_AZOMA|nr:hypothetical protein [Azomonas macrocytogenes]
MGIAELSFESRRYQLPAAPLSPFSLPRIGQAMQEARACSSYASTAIAWTSRGMPLSVWKRYRAD